MKSVARPSPDTTTASGFHVSSRLQGTLMAVAGAVILVGLSIGAMAVLTSPDSWVMKAATQAIIDQQQAIATSYLVNLPD